MNLFPVKVDDIFFKEMKKISHARLTNLNYCYFFIMYHLSSKLQFFAFVLYKISF